MSEIDRIMYMIDWNRSAEEQEEGVRLARNIVCLTTFFQPIGPDYSKSVWDNCARILAERPDSELQPYSLEMLRWLEDLNWPGAETILERLIMFQDVSFLVVSLDKLVPVLKMLDNQSWLYFLSFLLKNNEIANQIKPETKDILTEACDTTNWGHR